jgi:hypothetical protein
MLGHKPSSVAHIASPADIGQGAELIDANLTVVTGASSLSAGVAAVAQ